jgi:hypothetical protein
MGQDLTPELLATNPPLLEQPSVFILFRHPELSSVIKDLYPNGDLESHYNFDNLVSFISYRVVPSTADIAPPSLETSTLSSPGWQLIFVLIVFWIGYIAYQHYSSNEPIPRS